MRSWLCGILRFKVSRLRRAEGREPVHRAEALELAEELPSTDEPAVDLAMDKEEQAILWGALERVPELYREPRDRVGSAAGQYRSRWSLLGVPLVHLRFSAPDEGERPVFGWFAGGDRAYGILFAWGGLAVAPISVGAVAIGIIAVGSLSVGVISLGTAGVGLVAVGCMAVGVRAYGWLYALGWNAAQGSGFAISRFAAEGPVALAPHANDAIARQLLADPQAEQNQMLVFIVITLLSLLPVAYYARAVRRRLGRVGR